MARIQKGEADAHDEEEGGEGPELEVLAGGEVPAGDFVGANAERAVEDSLDHPEEVGGSEDDAGGGEDGPEDVVRDDGLHGAGEDEELADEAVEHGEAGGGEDGDDEHRDHPGVTCGEAAVVAHVVGAVALVEQAEEDEEGGADERLVEDLEDAAVEADDREGEDAENDEGDVREGGEGGQLLEVGLDERDERAVDDADGAEMR